MNLTNKRISEDTIFVEDPTNFDVTVNPKTGQASYGYSFVSKVEDLPASDVVDDIIVDENIDFLEEHFKQIQATGSRDIKKAKSFYEGTTPAEQEKVIGSFIEHANTVTFNVGELRQLSLI